MTPFAHLRGVYAAALTPLDDQGEPALDELPAYLEFLAARGCHGALLMGTTGEGPSFSPRERSAVLRAALQARNSLPGFRLLLGTGTPSLDESIELTRLAFELGADGVVTLPPYYFRKVDDEGLFAWFSRLIERAVPEGGALFGYHIPSMSGVPLSIELLDRLRRAYPRRFAGLKDSSADPDTACRLGDAFGDTLLTLNGTDSLFGLALDHRAGGCITAMATMRSPDLRRVWEAHAGGDLATRQAAQDRLTAARTVMTRFPPNPPLYKGLLWHFHGFRHWPVRPPLMPFSTERVEQAAAAALAEGTGFAE